MRESDWLGDVEETAPRRRGGRLRVNGAGDRSRKLECPECGFICRTSAGALERAGFPSCGCGTVLEAPNLRDRMRLEPETVEEEIGRFSLREQNRIWRELGYLDLVVPLDADGRLKNLERRSGAAPRTCQWDGGYCNVYVSGQYCAEHDPHKLARREARSGA